MRALLALLSVLLAASACAPLVPGPAEPVLFVYKYDPPAFVQLDQTWRPVRTIPFSMPAGCDPAGVHAPPQGFRLAIELSCAFGPSVLLLEVRTAEVRQLITDSDSHFMAWSPDGRSMYLKVDSINRPRVVRLGLRGQLDSVPISELTYDLAPDPSGDAFAFAFSPGMGQGSELWLASGRGAITHRLAVDLRNYLALASWSPDGQRVAFIKIPDSATPFTSGALWVMQRDGGGARRLATADAGHGFAPVWSPDGKRLVFVVRENPEDHSADTSSQALISNLYVVGNDGGQAVQLTNLSRARVEQPVWKPGADIIVFSARLDDRMAVYVLELIAGSTQAIPIHSICCAAWLQE